MSAICLNVRPPTRQRDSRRSPTRDTRPPIFPCAGLPTPCRLVVNEEEAKQVRGIFALFEKHRWPCGRWPKSSAEAGGSKAGRARRVNSARAAHLRGTRCAAAFNQHSVYRRDPAQGPALPGRTLSHSRARHLGARAETDHSSGGIRGCPNTNKHLAPRPWRQRAGVAAFALVRPSSVSPWRAAWAARFPTFASRAWTASQIRPTATLRLVNFFTGLSSVNGATPAKLFQISTGRLAGQEAASLASSWEEPKVSVLLILAARASSGETKAVMLLFASIVKVFIATPFITRSNQKPSQFFDPSESDSDLTVTASRAKVNTMQLETTFLRLRTPVTIGSRFGDWEVTWLGGWTRDRLSYLVMAVRIPAPPPRRAEQIDRPRRIKPFAHKEERNQDAGTFPKQSNREMKEPECTTFMNP